MIINVDIEVPDGDYCRIKSNETACSQLSSFDKCSIFNEELWKNGEYGIGFDTLKIRKCKKCLEKSK